MNNYKLSKVNFTKSIPDLYKENVKFEQSTLKGNMHVEKKILHAFG